MMRESVIGRRSAVALGLGLGAAAVARRVRAEMPKEVKIAMLVPLSGPWARSGILERMGAEMAVEDINRAGGVKSLAGAKLKLLEYDAGDSVEKAKDAAQRMVAQEPDLVGGFGAWLSSFTLAVTEVTERAELPWLTLSYSDLIAERGFKYIFQTSPTSATQARQIIPTVMGLAESATGKRPTRMAIISDNTAASESFIKAIHEHVLAEQKLTVVLEQIYAPPLADATTLVQPVRAARPDFVIMESTNTSDNKLLLEKFAEYQLSGGRLPLIGGAASFATPDLLRATGADILQGLMVELANWPGKAHAELAQRFVARTKEPWFGFDSFTAYAHVMILKQALEQAGVADRKKVAEAIRAMDMTDGPAGFFPDNHLKFDAKGRRLGLKLVVVQWQNGKPLTIFPRDMAVAQPIWGKA